MNLLAVMVELAQCKDLTDLADVDSAATSVDAATDAVSLERDASGTCSAKADTKAKAKADAEANAKMRDDTEPLSRPALVTATATDTQGRLTSAKEEFARHAIPQKLITLLENKNDEHLPAQERARISMGGVLCSVLEESELHTVTHLTHRCISQLCLDLEKKQQGKWVFMSLHDILVLLVKVRFGAKRQRKNTIGREKDEK